MARLELPLKTELRFGDAEEAARVLIRFRDRDFIWYANLERTQSGLEPPFWPTVTVMVNGSSDVDPARRAMQHFLSVLAFNYERAIVEIVTGMQEWTQVDDPPVHLQQGGNGRAPFLTPPPAELVAVNDGRLALALAHYREAVNSDSPFYRFLAYWNALDVLFGGDSARMKSHLDAASTWAPGWFRGHPTSPRGWGRLLQRVKPERDRARSSPPWEEVARPGRS